MPGILYAVIAFFVYGAGDVLSPSPKVITIENGIVTEENLVTSPILVVTEGDKTEIRITKKEGVTFRRLEIPDGLYLDIYGEWTSSCGNFCEE